jgi:cyclohexadienyl dehydratase
MKKALWTLASALLCGIAMASGVAYAQSAPAASQGGAAVTSRLDEILARGTLRACTTGDYKPYSFDKGDGHFEGIDIDLADSLAKSLGVKVEYVKTSWSNLMSDFVAKCDIGVGGVSPTLERQRRAFLPSPMRLTAKRQSYAATT